MLYVNNLPTFIYVQSTVHYKYSDSKRQHSTNMEYGKIYWKKCNGELRTEFRDDIFYPFWFCQLLVSYVSATNWTEAYFRLHARTLTTTSVSIPRTYASGYYYDSILEMAMHLSLRWLQTIVVEEVIVKLASVYVQLYAVYKQCKHSAVHILRRRSAEEGVTLCMRKCKWSELISWPED